MSHTLTNIYYRNKYACMYTTSKIPPIRQSRQLFTRVKDTTRLPCKQLSAPASIKGGHLGPTMPCQKHSWLKRVLLARLAICLETTHAPLWGLEHIVYLLTTPATVSAKRPFYLSLSLSFLIMMCLRAVYHNVCDGKYHGDMHCVSWCVSLWYALCIMMSIMVIHSLSLSTLLLK